MCAWHGVAGIVLFFAYKPPTFHTKYRHDELQAWDMIKSIDYVGLFLFSAGCVLFLVGLSFGGNSAYSWTDATVLAPLVVGLVSLIGFGTWEVVGRPQYPLMPPRLFLNVRG